MRSTLIIMLVLLVLMAGCSGVIMNPKYAELLDKTSILSDAWADRAEAGTMTPEEKTAALRANADFWAEFRAAKDGKTTGEQ